MCSERSVMGAESTGAMSRALQPDRCPPDPEGVAEAYVMDKLPRADRAAFGEHMLTCAGCRQAVEDAERYGTAVRKATRRLRAQEGRRG